MEYQDKFMDFIMTPPQQEKAKYTMYRPQVSTMRIISDPNSGSGLGDVPVANVGDGSNQNTWVMPVVIIVVSAMALMTLYAVLSKR